MQNYNTLLKSKSQAPNTRDETMKQADLEKMSIADLEITAALIKTIVETKRAKARDDLRAELITKAEKLGFDPKEVFAKARKPVAVKYRNGDHTWTGRGRRPNWMKTLDSKQMEKYIIK